MKIFMRKYLLKILDKFFPRWLTDIYMQKRPILTFVKPVGENPALFSKIANVCDTYAGKRYVDKFIVQFKELDKKKIDLVSFRSQIMFVGVLAALGKYNKPNILDLGGGVGEDYFTCKNFCGDSLGKWIIVENSPLVKRLEPLIEGEEKLTITDRMDKISMPIHLAYIGGALQYLDPPFEYIDNIIKLDPDFIYINKTPFWDKPTIAAKQVGRKVVHEDNKKYRLTSPIWIFNEKEVTEYIVGKKYEKIPVKVKCDNYYILKYGILWYKTFLFRKRKAYKI